MYKRQPAEETYFRCPIRAANIANALEELGVPGIKDVWCDPAGATRLWVVVSIKQEYAGHAKQVGQLVSQMPQNVFLGKYIIVVDEDVDVFDQSDVIWALGTRVHTLVISILKIIPWAQVMIPFHMIIFTLEGGDLLKKDIIMPVLLLTQQNFMKPEMNIPK